MALLRQEEPKNVATLLETKKLATLGWMSAEGCAMYVSLSHFVFLKKGYLYCKAWIWVVDNLAHFSQV